MKFQFKNILGKNKTLNYNDFNNVIDKIAGIVAIIKTVNGNNSLKSHIGFAR